MNCAGGCEVAVGSVIARGPAGRTYRKPCEKNGLSGGEPISHNSRAGSSKLRLNLPLENVQIDDGRSSYLYDLSASGLRLPRVERKSH